MLRIRRKVTPLKFTDFECIPQDTPDEEATDSDEEELRAAIFDDNSIEECEDDIDSDLISRLPDIPKPDRRFTILIDSVVSEENSPVFVYANTRNDLNTVEMFTGKTPMQAARVAFNFIASDSNRKSTYVFSIEECATNYDKMCKTYSYRGIRDAHSDCVSIKAYKLDNSSGIPLKKHKKPKSVIPTNQTFESDGFFVEKKIIPPLKHVKK